MAHDEQHNTDGWQAYIDWSVELRNKISVNQNDITFKASLDACTGNEARFAIVWRDETIRKQVEAIYAKQIKLVNAERERSQHSKSQTVSKQSREIGNKYFKEHQYKEALKCYTKAVKFGAHPTESRQQQQAGDDNSQNVDDDSLALALANRSAALYALSRYRLCLLDIDLALKFGYPFVNRFKLLIRKVKCLHVLSVWDNDVENIKAYLKSILTNKDTKDFIKVEIQNMFEFIEQTKPEEVEKDETDVVDELALKISNVNKSLVQAADCVELSYDDGKGRYLITSKDASFGRLLIVEDPFVCNLASSLRNEYCYNCFTKLYGCGIACCNCVKVLYCSEDCRNAKASTHSYECNKFLEFQDFIGVAYLVAHILFKINFDPCANVLIHSKKIETSKEPLRYILDFHLSDWPEQIFKNDYTSVLSLLDHASSYEFEELFRALLTASYLLTAFKDLYPEFNEKHNSTDSEIFIGSIILMHFLQLKTNLISIIDQNIQAITTSGYEINFPEERPIGIGIYPTISLLNHSCSPNIFSIFHKNKFVARASQTLKCGTEINYCYGPSVRRMTKKDRQAELKAQYFFICQCESCSTNHEDESRALLCTECNGPVICNKDNTHECLHCHRKDFLDVESRLGETFRLHKAFITLKAENGEKEGRREALEPSEKIKALENLEANLSKLVYWRNPLFMQIKKSLVDCALDLENLTLALKYSNDELFLCERTHGIGSYELVMTKMKHINIKWQEVYYEIEGKETIEDKKEACKTQLEVLLESINSTRFRLRELLASTSILGAEKSFDVELKFLSDIQSNINKYMQSVKEPEAAG